MLFGKRCKQVIKLDLMLAKGLSPSVFVVQQSWKMLKKSNNKTPHKSCRNLPLIALIVYFGTIFEQINLPDH